MILLKCGIVLGTFALLQAINQWTGHLWQAERKRKRRLRADACYKEDVRRIRGGRLTDRERRIALSLLMTRRRRAGGQEALGRYQCLERTGFGVSLMKYVTMALLLVSVCIGSPIGGERFILGDIDAVLVGMMQTFGYVLVVQQVGHALLRQQAALQKVERRPVHFTLREFFKEEEWNTLVALAEQEDVRIDNVLFDTFTSETVRFLSAKEKFVAWEKEKATFAQEEAVLPKWFERDLSETRVEQEVSIGEARLQDVRQHYRRRLVECLT